MPRVLDEANGRVQAVPSCLLVHFMAADLEESRGNTESSRQIYEDLVQGTLSKEDAAASGPAKAQSRPEVSSSCMHITRDRQVERQMLRA